MHTHQQNHLHRSAICQKQHENYLLIDKNTLFHRGYFAFLAGGIVQQHCFVAYIFTGILMFYYSNKMIFSKI